MQIDHLMCKLMLSLVSCETEIYKLLNKGIQNKKYTCLICVELQSGFGTEKGIPSLHDKDFIAFYYLSKWNSGARLQTLVGNLLQYKQCLWKWQRVIEENWEVKTNITLAASKAIRRCWGGHTHRNLENRIQGESQTLIFRELPAKGRETGYVSSFFPLLVLGCVSQSVWGYCRFRLVDSLMMC